MRLFFPRMLSSWIHKCWKLLFITVLFRTPLFLDAQDGMFGVGRFDLVQLFPPLRCVCSLRTRLSLCLKITIVSVSSSFPLQSRPISLLPSPCRRLILETVLILNPSGRFDLQARYSFLMKVNTAHQSSHPPSHRSVPFRPDRRWLRLPRCRSASLPSTWMTWRSFLCDRHPRVSGWSAELPEIKRAWTEACIPLITCIWRGRTAKR